MAGSSISLKTHDFGLVDADGEAAGILRIKPAHVWWKGVKDSKWRRIEFERIVDLIKLEGEEIDPKPGQSSNASV
jgi:hypothetical protein